MGFLATLFTQAGFGWLLRRVPDWGGHVLGWLGGLFALFMQLDPATQAIIVTVLQGNWQEITLGSAIGFVIWALSQWRSWRATVSPHVVTTDRRVLTEDQARAETGWT